MIPFVDLSGEYTRIKPAIDEAINRVLKRGYFVLGPEVENFEKKFAAYGEMPYCVGVNSGTDALYLALLCAGIGPGDEVIVPVNTAIPTAMTVVMTGARPVFVDCDDNFLLDLDLVPKVITSKVRAIIPVHLYGRACNMDRVAELASRHDLIIIEDCAQAAGAAWQGRKVGTWGRLACFSFYPTKNLGAYGDGGAIIARDEVDYTRLRALRFYGQTKKVYVSELFGVNSRLDELQAAILAVKLDWLDEWNREREKAAAHYQKLLPAAGVRPPAPASPGEHVYHVLVGRSAQREGLRAHLQSQGIHTLIHYPVPLHRQPFFAPYAAGQSFPRAEEMAPEIFSLPIFPHLTPDEITTVCNTIKTYGQE